MELFFGGNKSFSCINAVHNRAMRFYLGVGKYTPNAAVSGEMGWVPPVVRQWKHIANFWVRLSQTNDTRLNKRIAMWAHGKSSRCKNWFSVIGKHFTQFKIENFNNLDRPLHKQSFINGVEKATMNIYLADWLATLNKVNGSASLGRNKLRTYRTFKQVYETEGYCNLILPPSHRSALCKFRCGVSPIRIETGRYENLQLDDRKCPFCNVPEDELHVYLH